MVFERHSTRKTDRYNFYSSELLRCKGHAGWTTFNVGLFLKKHQSFSTGRFMRFNPLWDRILKLQRNVSLYSNTVIGTLAVDGWAVIFGTARRGLGGLRPRSVPSLLYQITAHPSTASVGLPTSYHSMWHWHYNCLPLHLKVSICRHTCIVFIVEATSLIVVFVQSTVAHSRNHRSL